MTRMRWPLALLITTFALGAAPAAVVAVPSASQASFVFGRTGGNIMPFTIGIARDGTVTARGPVQPSRHQLSVRTLARLTTLASTQHFFALRHQTNCPGSLPDFAFRVITVRTSEASRTVLVRGGCRPGFNVLYAALSAAVGAG